MSFGNDNNLYKLREALRKIDRIFARLRELNMKNDDKRSRNQKIAEALHKQGVNGSPYSESRYVNGIQGTRPASRAENKEPKEPPPYFAVDNLIYPFFHGAKKSEPTSPALVVNHATGKITSSEDE